MCISQLGKRYVPQYYTIWEFVNTSYVGNTRIVVYSQLGNSFKIWDLLLANLLGRTYYNVIRFVGDFFNHTLVAIHWNCYVKFSTWKQF